MLNILYRTLPGRLLLKPLTSPVFSRIGGFLLNTRLSACMVEPFVRKYKICMDDYEKRKYNSFNDFFSRKILPEKRRIAPDWEALISPCDGRLSCYPIAENSHFKVKHVVYTLESLLKNRRLAERYRGGILLVFRLTVDNYHHFCYIADGRRSKNVRIPGVLHTVRPVATGTVPVYAENARQYSLLKTENFGVVLMMEVGAMLVGRIVNLHEPAEVRKGQEKGYFEFGGSTVILCFQRGILTVNDRIWEDSRAGRETPVRMGERIGTGRPCQPHRREEKA